MKLKSKIQMYVRRLGLRVPVFLLDSSTRDMRLLANTLTKDDLVIDFGAHVGNATTEFARRAKHVHAFEPNPIIFEVLQRQTKLYPNVTLHNKAISDVSAKVDLFYENIKPGKHFEGSTIVSNKSNVSYCNKVTVDAVDVSSFIESLGESVTCVKMDIEGAEYKVLDRLLETKHINRIGKLYIECHVDRIEGLADKKKKTIEAAKAAGVFDKLDFEWQ